MIKNSIGLEKYDTLLHYLKEIKKFEEKVKNIRGEEFYLETAIPLLEA